MSVISYVVQSRKSIKEVPVGNTMLPISRTDGGKGKSGNVMLVPVVSDTLISLIQANDAGKQFLIDAIDSLRAKIASNAVKNGKTVDSVLLGIDSLLQAMAQENEGTRFSRKALEVWFDAHMRPLIETAIKAKNASMAQDKLDALCNGYLKAFGILAADVGNRYMDNGIKAQLIKALELLPADHDHFIAEEIALRLDTVKAPEAMLGALD
jgi:hypothetical protein